MVKPAPGPPDARHEPLDAGPLSAPFQSYAEDRLSDPRFHIRRVENVHRLYPAHKHDYFQIVYYETPAPPIRIGLRLDRPVPGAIYFIAPMVPHQIRFRRETRCVVLYFDLDVLRPDLNRSYPIAELVRRAPELMPFAAQMQNDFILDAAERSRIEAAIDAMAAQAAGTQICSSEIIRAQLGLMLATFCQTRGVSLGNMPGQPAALGREGAHMRRIADFIGSHYVSGPSLSDAASAVGLSKSRLCALIRRHTGRTFSTLIREMRIEDAKERLAMTPDSITQIAFAVGYQDEKYFMRAFKATIGMTPGAYRAAAASGIAGAFSVPGRRPTTQESTEH